MSDKLKKSTDHALVRQLQQGNRQALGALYDKYSPALMGVIIRIAGDKKSAEDILQDVFLGIWEKIKEFDASEGHLFTWMLQMARNSALKAAAAKKSGRQASRGEEKYVSTVDMQEKTASGKCPAFELIFFKGYDFARAAAELNCTTEELKKQVKAELQQFRRATVHG